MVSWTSLFVLFVTGAHWYLFQPNRRLNPICIDNSHLHAKWLEVEDVTNPLFANAMADTAFARIASQGLLIRYNPQAGYYESYISRYDYWRQEEIIWNLSGDTVSSVLADKAIEQKVVEAVGTVTDKASCAVMIFVAKLPLDTTHFMH